MATYAVIMAGGSGTRFWPLSTPDRPKQLLALGPSPESLLRCTVARVAPLVPSERVVVVTTTRIADAVRKDVPELAPRHVLAEPAGRNTAPCIGWAAAHLVREDPDATMVVLPADHHIEDQAAFLRVLETAIAAAADGALVTCGIEPTRPETGYGYIEVGDEVAPGVRASVRFVEKPDRARAEAFVAGGRHLWNSGLFVFRARAILDAIREHLPELGAALDAALALPDAVATDAALVAAYGTLPAISIDHGVMERARRVLVVPGAFGWSDLGSFETAYELGAKDAEQNVLRARCVSVDARRNLVHAPAGKRVALLGVSDLVVIDTGTELLVMPRERSQDVRSIVDALAREPAPDGESGAAR